MKVLERVSSLWAASKNILHGSTASALTQYSICRNRNPVGPNCYKASVHLAGVVQWYQQTVLQLADNKLQKTVAEMCC